MAEERKLTTAFHSFGDSISVTRLDAARRQLHTAIALWFQDADPISIHTLASAAHQVIHDLNRAKKGPPMLFDAPWIREEVRKQYVGILKSDSNFFKHADKRGAKTNQADSIEFNAGRLIYLRMLGVRPWKNVSQPKSEKACAE